MTALLLAAPIYRQAFVTLVQTDVVAIQAKGAKEADAKAQALALNDPDADGMAAMKLRETFSFQAFASSTVPKTSGAPVPSIKGFDALKADEPYVDLSRAKSILGNSVPWIRDDAGKSLYLRYIVSIEPHEVWVLATSAATAVAAARAEWVEGGFRGKPADWSRFDAGCLYPEIAAFAPLRHGFEYVSTSPYPRK